MAKKSNTAENDVPANEVPKNIVVRKPTEKKAFSLDDFKKKNNYEDIPDRPLEWISCSDALEKACGLKGLPIGFVTLVRSYTNAGKSTLVCESVVSSQKMGIFPIIIDTENNLSLEHLVDMGFDLNGNFLLIDNEYLLERFGKLQNKNRTEASIEDLAMCIKHFIKEQESGNLPFDLLFAVDSIGTLNCIKTIDAQVKNDSDNNMWNAGAYEKSFMNLLNNTIPNSRRVNREHTITFVAAQKIWYDPMNKIIKHKGGELTAYSARLIYHMGGVLSHGTKKIIATSKGKDVTFGTEAKINVFKNQVDGPLGGISMSGSLISTKNGFVHPDDIDEYKKKNILFFRNLFGDDVNIEDIKTVVSEAEGDESDGRINPNSNFDSE